MDKSSQFETAYNRFEDLGQLASSFRQTDFGLEREWTPQYEMGSVTTPSLQFPPSQAVPLGYLQAMQNNWDQEFLLWDSVPDWAEEYSNVENSNWAEEYSNVENSNWADEYNSLTGLDDMSALDLNIIQTYTYMFTPKADQTLDEFERTFYKYRKNLYRFDNDNYERFDSSEISKMRLLGLLSLDQNDPRVEQKIDTINKFSRMGDLHRAFISMG